MLKSGIGRWVALCVALAPFMAGCSHDRRTTEQKIDEHMQAARAAIEEHVSDKPRAAKLIALTDEIDRLMDEQSSSLAVFVAKLNARNADPASTAVELKAMIDTYLGERHERRTKALGIHFQLIELTQPDEWKHIVDAELAALHLGTSLEES